MRTIRPCQNVLSFRISQFVYGPHRVGTSVVLVFTASGRLVSKRRVETPKRRVYRSLILCSARYVFARFMPSSSEGARQRLSDNNVCFQLISSGRNRCPMRRADTTLSSVRHRPHQSFVPLESDSNKCKRSSQVFRVSPDVSNAFAVGP